MTQRVFPPKYIRNRVDKSLLFYQKTFENGWDVIQESRWWGWVQLTPPAKWPVCLLLSSNSTGVYAFLLICIDYFHHKNGFRWNLQINFGVFCVGNLESTGQEKMLTKHVIQVITISVCLFGNFHVKRKCFQLTRRDVTSYEELSRIQSTEKSIFQTKRSLCIQLSILVHGINRYDKLINFGLLSH